MLLRPTPSVGNGVLAPAVAIRDLSSVLEVPPNFPVAFGGFSALYRGVLRRYPDESMEVAVKLLKVTDTGGQERSLKRLNREALLLSAVEHPLIVKLYGTAIVEGRPALVLQWYNKGDASKYLKDKDMSEKLSIIKNIARGLEFLHSKNIVHGDVKGKNVLISDSGHGALTDFGLSRMMETRTGITTSSLSGSIPWLSPELVIPLCDAQSNVTITRTTASDVWAFGCTAFELLSGTLPYADAKNPFQIPSMIRQGVLPSASSNLRDIPPAIRVVLERCWQAEPSHRPTMAEVIRMLS